MSLTCLFYIIYILVNSQKINAIGDTADEVTLQKNVHIIKLTICIILDVVKRNPLFLHEIEWKNNGFLFTIPNISIKKSKMAHFSVQIQNSIRKLFFFILCLDSVNNFI